MFIGEKKTAGDTVMGPNPPNPNAYRNQMAIHPKLKVQLNNSPTLFHLMLEPMGMARLTN